MPAVILERVAFEVEVELQVFAVEVDVHALRFHARIHFRGLV